MCRVDPDGQQSKMDMPNQLSRLHMHCMNGSGLSLAYSSKTCKHMVPQRNLQITVLLHFMQLHLSFFLADQSCKAMTCSFILHVYYFSLGMH